MKKLSDSLSIQLLVVGISLLVIVGGIYIYSSKHSGYEASSQGTSTVTGKDATSSKATTTTNIKPVSAPAYATKCGLVVKSPLIDDRVSFPLVIRGVIDTVKPHQLGCVWNQVLSRGGPAELFYNLRGSGWKAPGIPVPIIITGSGGTASSSAFSASLNMYTTALGLPSGTPIKITFVELAEANSSPQDSFDMILYLK